MRRVLRGSMPFTRALRLAPLLALAACVTLGGPGWHGPKSDHFDGTHFHNYVRSSDRQLGDAIRRELHIITSRRGAWPEWQNVPTDTPPPRVGPGQLRVTFVNHSTVLIQLDGLNVLTDPIWSTRASPVDWFGPERHRPPGIRFEDLPPIDVVLLSHDHYDHLDVPTLQRLARRFHPRILTGLGNSAFLEKVGVDDSRDLDWWQSVELPGNVRVTAVPAQHWSARSLTDRRRTLWLGFVLESPAGRVYFAGDTGFGEILPMIHERFPSFRLAILPIAPIRPRKAMAARHMSSADAVHAAQLLDASTSLAVHFGTFQQGDDAMDEPLDSLRSALGAAGPCAPRFFGLVNGGARYVPAVDSTERARTDDHGCVRR